jgi:putative endonuclease
VAQLGARLDGIEEVEGSNPFGSTNLRPRQAGEGCRAGAEWRRRAIQCASYGSASQAASCPSSFVTYVYILHSVKDPQHFYVGVTSDLRERLKKHNAGEVSHTAKYAPWAMKTYIAFTDEKQAFAFEKYLKSASGRAFAKKRL